LAIARRATLFGLKTVLQAPETAIGAAPLAGTTSRPASGAVNEVNCFGFRAAGL
jgi:hypothetical protein